MQRKILKVLPCLLLLFIPSLTAETLSLDEAIQLATAKSDAVAASQLDAASSKRTTQINHLLPSFSVDGSATATGQLFDLANLSTSQSYSLSTSLSASASFSTADSTPYTKKTEQLNSISADLSVLTEKQTVRSTVTADYWNVVSCRLSLEEAQKALANQQEIQDSNQAKYDDGSLGKVSLSESELALVQAKQTVDSDKASLEAATKTLEKEIGKDIDPDQLEDLMEMKEPKGEKDLYTLIPKTSAMQSLQNAIALSNIEYKSDNYDAKVPTMTTSASVGLSSKIDSDSENTAADSSSVSLTVSVPLDAYFKNSSTAISLENDKRSIDVASYNYQAELTTMQQQVTSYLTSIQSYLSKKDSLEKQLELYTYLETQQKESYDAGISSYSDYQDAILDRENSNIAILQNQLNYTLYLHDLACYLEASVDNILK
ncbi:MAG: TolC family protein [Spirochaetia bacterium]|jgi:outer membrane protein TolC|nr:TolC family protein [Spirochaetia bacterium]